MPKPARPDLAFHNFDEMLADIEQLRHGYQQTGNWTLSMAVDHLAKAFTGEGMKPMPAPVAAVARSGIHWIAERNKYPQFKMPAPKQFRPTPGLPLDEPLTRLKHAVKQLQAVPGPTLSPTPFGTVSLEDFRKLQLLHAAHHLSYLRPIDESHPLTTP